MVPVGYLVVFVCILVFTTVELQEIIDPYEPLIPWCDPDYTNKVYSACGSPCPLTCENYKNPPSCQAVCVKGCFCKPGYVLYNKQCILIKQCPIQPSYCPKQNQTYYTNDFNGDTCDGVFIKYDKPGCYCGYGFVLNRLNGRCVHHQDCPKHPRDKVCPENEYVNSCKNSCEKTCKNPNDRLCLTPGCNYGCSCVEHLVRDETTGRCKQFATCPVIQKCPLNEKWKECGTRCEATCASPQRTCAKDCVRGCFCKEGYIRSSELDRCVPEWNCIF